MVYAKKLVVLTGAGGTGAVTLEKSAAGLNGRLNTYELPDVSRGGYVLALLGNRDRIIELGEAGRMTVNFSLDPQTEIASLHCAVARIDGDKVDIMLYGTLAPKKVWSGDIADYIRRKRPAKQVTAQSLYSSRRIEDYFFDILPASGGFHDGAVANINYYAPDFAEPPALSAEQTPIGAPVPEPPVEPPALSAESEPVTETEAAETQPTENPPQAEKVSQTQAETNEPPQPTAPQAAAETQPPQEEKPTRSLRSDPAALERAYLLKLAETAALTAAKSETVRQATVAATAVPQPQSDSFRLSGAPKPKPLSFYEMIKEKLDALFKTGVQCVELESIMPDTRWVKIDYDDRRYYAVGLIGARPDYVCYGVPARYTPTAPEELAGYCNWVPIKPQEPEGEGYWLLFQDADTGESIAPEL
ncbi:MAG: hypothetical protein HFK10_05370 [Clostridia bacterium]|nr:hypothetical protein [Clostridia bacterium]